MGSSSTVATVGLVASLLVGCSDKVVDDLPNKTDRWVDVSPQRATQFQQALENARAEQGLPGLAMAIAYRDTREIWVSATGSADLAAGRAWLPTDESRIGSVTKTFTAALVMQLIEEGKLALSDPIEKWVPGSFVGPTIEQLLTHSSGIVSYNYVADFDDSVPWTPESLVAWAYTHEPDLRFTPGHDWEYSNTNYVLLGLAIEAATGRSYQQELASRVFEPLDLPSMRLATSGDESTTLVHSYDESEPPIDNTAAVDPSFGWAAGAIVSTPRDLARWTIGLYGGEFLNGDSLQRMTMPNGLTGPDAEDYGLGTIIENGDGNSEYTLVGHTGGIGGYLTSAFYLQEKNAVVVVMSNRLETDVSDASVHGWAAVLDVALP